MWWETEDFAAAAELRRLADLLGGSREPSDARIPGEIIGFGSAKVDEKRVLLAVLHEGLLHPRAKFRHAAPRLAGAVRSLLGRNKPPSAETTLFDLDYVSPLGRKMLESLRLPQDTRFMFVDWPRPCAGAPCSGAAIRAGEKSGTLGLFLVDFPNSGIRVLATTAGHVIGVDATGAPQRAAVELEPRWWQGGRVIGHAIAAVDPIGTAGPDIAFLELLSSALGSMDPDWEPLVFQVRLLSSRPYDIGQLILWPAALAEAPAPEGRIGPLRGGKSGKRQGWVDDPLLRIRSSKDRVRQWSNCWTMFEIGGGFAQPGDSGGIVRTQSGAVIGHLVASMGVVTRRGRRQAGLIQDIHTVLASRPGASTHPMIPMIPQPLPLDQGWTRRLIEHLRR
jgi:hypothetical protein